jgi:geranylgeranyl diphosphate synthase type II
MDNAPVRRNRPTVHEKFSDNNAILSGDAMAFLSYQYLLECRSERMLDVLELFSKTAIEVCEGQQLDMDFESRLDVSQEEYLEMIRLKTAVLLACSLKAGAMLANASDKITTQLYEFGINLGWAFQLQDDLLDTFGDEKVFGKKIGGDILSNKKTFLLIHALNKSSVHRKKELVDWFNKTEFDPETKIRSVKNIYVQTEVEKTTREKIDFYFHTAIDLLERIPLKDVIKQPLENLAYQMLKRNH